MEEAKMYYDSNFLFNSQGNSNTSKDISSFIQKFTNNPRPMFDCDLKQFDSIIECVIPQKLPAEIESIETQYSYNKGYLTKFQQA